MSRGLRVAGLLLAAMVLLGVLAGVGTTISSSAPDGLERAALDTGIADTARDSATSDSPVADYRATGVADDRLAGAVAGVLGVAVAGSLFVGGLMFLRRSRQGELGAASDAPAAQREGA